MHLKADIEDNDLAPDPSSPSIRDPLDANFASAHHIIAQLKHNKEKKIISTLRIEARIVDSGDHSNTQLRKESDTRIMKANMSPPLTSSAASADRFINQPFLASLEAQMRAYPRDSLLCFALGTPTFTLMPGLSMHLKSLVRCGALVHDLQLCFLCTTDLCCLTPCCVEKLLLQRSQRNFFSLCF